MAELNVAVTLRIMPTETEVDLEKVKTDLDAIVSKYGKIHSTEIKPIAFGLKALEAVMLLSDSTGGIDEIEAEAARIEGVGSVEVTDLNRL